MKIVCCILLKEWFYRFMLKLLLLLEVLKGSLSLFVIVIFVDWWKHFFWSYVYYLSFVKLFVLFVDKWERKGIVRGCFR